MLKDHTAFNKRHQEINSELILEYKVQLYQERMVNRAQNILLLTQIVELLEFNHQVFADTLHGIELVLSLMMD